MKHTIHPRFLGSRYSIFSFMCNV